MNLPQPELQTATTLLDLLERDFQTWLDSSPAAQPSAEHRRLWEQAVREPAHAMLSRAGKLFRGRLVRTAYGIAGGDPLALPDELPQALEILHIGSLIIDDVQDGSTRRRGGPALHEVVGTPLAINTGNLFYCWSLDLLARTGLTAGQELDLTRRASRAMLRCHQGQALDLSVSISEVEQDEVPALVDASTHLKAGTLMELGAAYGAVAAGGSAETVAALGEFGHALGVGLQMLDDLSGVVNERRLRKGLEDLRLARPTWVWSWLAQDLEPGEYRGLQGWMRAVAEGADPQPLLAELRERLAWRGRAEVHRHLSGAMEGLRACLGPSAELTAISQEIERLERSFV